MLNFYLSGGTRTRVRLATLKICGSGSFPLCISGPKGICRSSYMGLKPGFPSSLLFTGSPHPQRTHRQPRKGRPNGLPFLFVCRFGGTLSEPGTSLCGRVFDQ